MQTVLTLTLSTEPSPQLQILFYTQSPSTEKSGNHLLHLRYPWNPKQCWAGGGCVILKVIQFEFRCSSSITGCAILVEKLICLRFPNEKEWKNGVYFYVPVAKANQQIFKRQYCILCASVSMFSLYSATLPCLQFFTSLFALTVRNGHVKDSWSLTLCLIKTDAVLTSGKGTNCIRQQQTPQ